jgi:CMP-N-acetylneuraminic acid synthetase/spore coat polysaccharide biosynthesis predicted glycosyltransferase SpsG
VTSIPAIAIIPARGGSKGVVGKNMRRLAGLPLIAHTVRAADESGVFTRIVISTDDEAVAGWAEINGFETLRRPAELAGDDATIAQVAAHVADQLDWSGWVCVLQPTSPLRSANSIVEAFDRVRATGSISQMSVIRLQHLHWFEETDGTHRPLFEGRKNRQYGRHPVLQETGAIQWVTSEWLRGTGQMVSESHDLYELPAAESLDIDTSEDLLIARTRAERATVVFRLTANRTVGSGHLYHCMQLAQELDEHRLVFLLRDCDPFVAATLSATGYEVVEETVLAADLERLAITGPRLVVNDVLDTTVEDVLAQRAAGYAVVSVEDLGEGARYADWVVNALYPLDSESAEHVVSGARWTVLRPEFLDLPDKVIQDVPTRILITFGGTDPSGLTPRVAGLLAAALPDVELVVVLGPGAGDVTLPDGVTVRREIRSMAYEMHASDLVITSAGRTVYEAAMTGTPTLVLAQSAREATHAHLSLDAGVVFLGIGTLTDDSHVVETVRRLLSDVALRREFSQRLRSSVDGRGARRIADQVNRLFQELK